MRELQNLIERLVVLEDADVLDEAAVAAALSGASLGDPPSRGLGERKREVEREEILRALRSARQNRSLAARLLGVSRRTLYNKLAEHDLLGER